MHLLEKKRFKIDKWIQPKTRSIQEQYCCCLPSDRCLLAVCANRTQEKRSTAWWLWTFSLCFWVAECSPSHEYQGQPASIIHHPAVLRCPYLHLYCRTSKWLSLFNIVAASPLQLLQLKDQPQLCSGAKSAHWWVAGWRIYKQGLVISYLLCELLNRVLWCFLNSMRIW